MEKLLETLSPNVGMTLIICATVLILAIMLAITFSIWHCMEIKAEKENKNKEPIDTNTQKQTDSSKANTSEEALTPEEKALKEELERKDRVLKLTEKLCALTKGNMGQFDLNAMKGLFDLYIMIDEYDKTGKKQAK